VHGEYPWGLGSLKEAQWSMVNNYIVYLLPASWQYLVCSDHCVLKMHIQITHFLCAVYTGSDQWRITVSVSRVRLVIKISFKLFYENMSVRYIR